MLDVIVVVLLGAVSVFWAPFPSTSTPRTHTLVYVYVCVCVWLRVYSLFVF